MSDRRLAVQAWESLFRAQHEIFADIGRDFGGDNALDLSEYDVLLNVVRAPGMTMRLREVTRWMLVSQPSVSRLVDRMVKRNLITKLPDPEDGRGALLRATLHGAEAFRAVARRHGANIAHRMAALSDEELSTLRELTEKLRGDATTEGSPPEPLMAAGRNYTARKSIPSKDAAAR